MIKVLILGSKEIDTINNAYIFDIYQELCFSEKELEEKLHQVIQSKNSLNAWAGAKKQLKTLIMIFDAIFSVLKMQ